MKNAKTNKLVVAAMTGLLALGSTAGIAVANDGSAAGCNTKKETHNCKAKTSCKQNEEKSSCKAKSTCKQNEEKSSCKSKASCNWSGLNE